MGFLMFLKLVAGSCDLFAWPLITLVYPLYASIRAIESNSLSDSKKCLTYWVICGLIMLFEFTSARLMEWLPFLPYAKLMFTVWLVASYFEGAVYAYDHFVRPCFSVDLQSFGYWLRPKQDEFGTGNSDSFLLLAKRFVQENGSDGLEKFISDKVKSLEAKHAIGENSSMPSGPNKANTEPNKAKCEEPKRVIGENDSVHTGNNKENTERNRIEMLDTSLAQTQHEAIAATENKPTSEAKVAVESSECAQSSIAENTQREWTCALCQVCAQSEISLQYHLQGKKHKAKIDMIKNSARTENRAKQSPGKTQKAEELLPKQRAAQNTLPQVNDKAVDIKETKRTKRAGEASESSINGQTPKKWKCALCEFYTSKEVSLQSHLQGKKHKAKEMEVLATIDANNTASTSASASASATASASAIVKLSDLWCEKCKLQCNSLSMLTDHLRGKRHLKGTSLFLC